MKRVLLLLLGVMIGSSAFALRFSYTYAGQELTYNVTGDKTCEVVFSDYSISGDLIIPDYAHYVNNKNETFEYQVAAISSYALSRSGLTSVSIPSSVVSISSQAFNECAGVLEYTVSDSNNNYCSVDGVLLDKNKSTIIRYPCGKTDSEYSIPVSVISIGDHAFYNCKNLTSITIGNSVTSIGNEAFLHCWDLITLTIGDGVKTIGKRAFLNCPGLESVHLGNSIETIGEEAFSDCYALNSLNEIPASVTIIGAKAFVACYELTGFKVNENNHNYCSVDGVLYNKSKTTLIQYFENNGRVGYAIPNTVNTIGESAFSCFSYLTYVDIPNSVTTIERDAFSGCGFTSVKIPNSVTSIGEMAFCNCMDLKTVTIPNSVDRIENGCFFCCFALKMVEISSSVTSIGEAAFSYCSSLTKIKVAADVPPTCISSNVFDSNAYSRATVYVPEKSVDGYKAADVWSGFKKIVADPDAGIDNVESDAAGVEVYNLGGVKVGNNLDGLPNGVYIMRQGSQSTKIVI